MKKLIFFIIVFGSNYISAQKWDTLSSGITNGFPVVLTQYNGNLIAGGLFQNAGGIFTGSIAQWNGNNWDTLSLSSSPYAGISIYAECVYQGTLIVAGGLFPSCEINQWNGITWDSLRTSEYKSVGVIEIRSFAVFKGDLYAAGLIGKSINSASNVAVWDGSRWDTLLSGTIKKNGKPSISTMVVYNGNLYVGGVFDTAGNVPAKNIAVWNGATWSAVGDGFNGEVSSLYVSNGTLYAGGNFDSSGTHKMNYISNWDGAKWNSLGSGIQPGVQYGRVSSIIQYGSFLCAAGSFDSAGGQRVNNIAFWDGTNWNKLGLGITGNDVTVFSLSIYNGALIAAGSFDTAGGMPANNIAQWISPLGVNEIANNTKLNVYPNPSNGSFTLSLSNINTIYNIEIYNVLGQQVYKANINSDKSEINLSEQPNGVYLYRVTALTGELIGEGKVMVQK